MPCIRIKVGKNGKLPKDVAKRGGINAKKYIIRNSVKYKYDGNQIDLDTGEEELFYCTIEKKSRKSRKSRKVSKKKSRKSRKSRKPKSKCRSYLSKKIRKNMKEKRYKSRGQAIAVSYSQVLKKHPQCKRSLRKRR